MNVCRELTAGLFSLGNSFLSTAWGSLFGKINHVEDITFFDGSTMPGDEFKAVSAKIDRLIEGDTKHILKRSMRPHHEIPPKCLERFKEIEIADANGAIDPRVTRILQNAELAVFHLIGGGAAARGARVAGDFYQGQVSEQYQNGDPDGAKQSLKRMAAARDEQSAASIRSYEQLVREGLASIKED